MVGQRAVISIVLSNCCVKFILLLLLYSDYNEILFQYENLGSNLCPLHAMQLFFDVFADCNMNDNGLQRLPIYLNHGQSSNQNIQERLDQISG